MPPTSALAPDACLAALAARRAHCGRVPSRSRVPRAGTNNASDDVGEDDIRNDTMPANARREPRKAVRLARRAMLAAPPALVAVAAVRSADAAAPGEWGYADFETGPLRWGGCSASGGVSDRGCAACARAPSTSLCPARTRREGGLARGRGRAREGRGDGRRQQKQIPPRAGQGVNKDGGLDAPRLRGRRPARVQPHLHTPAENIRTARRE